MTGDGNKSNLEIYDQNYGDKNLRLDSASKYDRRMAGLRMDLLHEYSSGKDVLDLCCGTGSYLIPILDQVSTAVGLDFSSTMLEGLRENLGNSVPDSLRIVQEDAREISLDDSSIDLVFSFTSLYHVPDVDRVIAHVARVLRPKGVAILEFGNLYSLNTSVCNVQHRDQGWAKPYHIRIRRMKSLLKENGLEIEDRRAFQVLPMYGAPRRLKYLYPLLWKGWKRLLGVSVAGKMMDERISSLWPFRLLAFRHIFIVRKP